MKTEAGPVDCYGAGETVLSHGEISATGLALDATHVYWSSPGFDCSSGQIRRIPKAGGEAVTLAADEPAPRAVAVDDSRVYFFDGCGEDAVRSVAKSGGPVDDLLVDVDLVDDARVLAADAQNVYFNDYGLLRIPKTGGTHQVLDSTVFATALVADAVGVFWAGPMSDGYGIMAYQPGDPSASLLTSVSATGNGLALDETNVYFTANGEIRRVSREGGPEYVVVADANAWKLAVDGTHVYWTEGVVGSCSVKKAPKTGDGETTEIASCTGGYLDIAVDDACVYWANLYGDNVVRAPK